MIAISWSSIIIVVILLSSGHRAHIEPSLLVIIIVILSLSEGHRTYHWDIVLFLWYLQLKLSRNNVLFTESGSFSYIRTICTSSTCAPFQQSLFCKAHYSSKKSTTSELCLSAEYSRHFPSFSPPSQLWRQFLSPYPLFPPPCYRFSPVPLSHNHPPPSDLSISRKMLWSSSRISCPDHLLLSDEFPIVVPLKVLFFRGL